MLVIGRRQGEHLLVTHGGEELRLTVWLDESHIKVGITAPHSFLVMRPELKGGTRERPFRHKGVGVLQGVHQVDQVGLKGDGLET